MDDEHFCISDTLKNDGIHNCPPPSNADEPNSPFPFFGNSQQQREQQQQQQQQYQSRRIQKRLTGNATAICPKNGLFYLITLASLMIMSTMF